MGPDPPPYTHTPPPFPSGPGASRAPLKLSLPPKVGAGLRAVERQIWESRTSLEEDVQALLELLARLGKETQAWARIPWVPGAPRGPSVRLSPRDFLLALVYTGFPLLPSHKHL